MVEAYRFRKPLISHCCLFLSMATYLLLLASPLITQPKKKKKSTSFLINLFRRNPPVESSDTKRLLPRVFHVDPSIQPSCVSFIHVFPERLQSTQPVRLPPVQGSRIALSQNWMTFGLHANWKI